MTICKLEVSFPRKLAPSIFQSSNPHVYDWVTYKAFTRSNCTWVVYYWGVNSPALLLSMGGVMKWNNNGVVSFLCV